MLSQIVAWLIGIPVIALALAYLLILSSLLAAKLRQSHAGFPQQHAILPAIREASGTVPRRRDSR